MCLAVICDDDTAATTRHTLPCHDSCPNSWQTGDTMHFSGLSERISTQNGMLSLSCASLSSAMMTRLPPHDTHYPVMTAVQTAGRQVTPCTFQASLSELAPK